METNLNIPAHDGKVIFTVLNQPAAGASDTLIVIGHGLTGHPYEYLHQHARDYFTGKGYDVVRMAFYWGEPNMRTLPDTTLDLHAKDLLSVINHYKRDYKSVFYIGHSYGGLTGLIANPDVNGIVFWDSTYCPSWMESKAVHIPEIDAYIFTGGRANLIGKAMFDEGNNLPMERVKEYAVAFKPPALVVKSGANLLHHGPLQLFEGLAGQKDYVVIDGADHCFYKGDTVTDLLVQTEAWISDRVARH